LHFGRYKLQRATAVVVDVVESDDPEQVARAVMLIRGYGHATTETLPATPWREFLDSL
jgi:uncharacterized protein with GYD domain